MNRSRTFTGLTIWALVVVVIIALPTSVDSVKASTPPLTITIKATATGQSANINFVQTKYPFSVGFSAQANLAAVSYLWRFGDGTNSTAAAPTHSYSGACVYEASVVITDAQGHTNHGNVTLGMFTVQGSRGSIVVCPAQGTAGFTPVWLGGGYFTPSTQVNVLMNGTSIANVITDTAGNFRLDVNSSLPPSVNGTVFIFTTRPSTNTVNFTTLEGIRAHPSSGVPGDTVIIEGRSYQAFAEVGISLGGAYLGQAQADGNGTFMTAELIPAVPPLTLIGTYPYSTTPPIQGTGASFRITANSYLAEAFSLWWLFLLIIAIVIVIIYYLRRRRRQRAQSRLQSVTVPQPPHV